MPIFPVLDLPKGQIGEIAKFLDRNDLVETCKASQPFKHAKLTLNGALSLRELSSIFNWACLNNNSAVISHLLHYYQISFSEEPDLALDTDALKTVIHLVDDDGNTFLHQVCLRKDDRRIAMRNSKLLLQLGLDFNTSNAKGETPWSLAIKVKSVGMVRFLISKGADVNVSIGDKKAQTPLKLALLLAEDNPDNRKNEDSHELVKCLLDAEAVVECKTHGSGLALLQQCVATGQPRCFDLILKAWKKQEFMLEYSNPAVTLCAAAMLGDMPLVHQLLKEGNVDANCTAYGSSPLIAAITVGNNEMIKLFMKHTSSAGFEQMDAANRTPLHLAILHGREKGNLVRQLLPLTTRIRPGDTIRKRTPLVDAVTHQSPETLALILERVLTNSDGPNKEESEVYLGLRQWNTPKKILTAEDNAVAALETAIMTQNYAAVRVIIDHPANPAQELGQHKLLLHMAFFYGDSDKMDDIVVALIEWGAVITHIRGDPEKIKEKEKWLNITNLMAAADTGCTKALQALTKSGADVNVMTVDLNEDKKDVKNESVEEKKDENNELVVEKKDISGELVDEKKDKNSEPVKEPQTKMKTALTGAVANNHTEAVRVLLEAGADTHVRMHSTPWHSMQLREAAEDRRVSAKETLFEHAVGCGFTEVVKLLMPHFDMKKQFTINGGNALMAAVYYNHPQTAAYLLDSGSFDLKQKNFKEKTAQDLARTSTAKMSTEPIFTLPAALLFELKSMMTEEDWVEWNLGQTGNLSYSAMRRLLKWASCKNGLRTSPAIKLIRQDLVRTYIAKIPEFASEILYVACIKGK
ncbi:ankyrin repeat-containing domain protein [Aspergillus multicolor]|uniref:ankyrin repeat domain-containing protein n=1 Tax=Aspergillus multicolor TaxID=41759 RepID=UPI003CCC9291